jgi:hypothetical protein
VHAVFDGVGKDTFEQSLTSLRKRGMCVLFGAASGQVSVFPIYVCLVFPHALPAGAHRPKSPHPGQLVPDPSLPVCCALLHAPLVCARAHFQPDSTTLMRKGRAALQLWATSCLR